MINLLTRKCPFWTAKWRAVYSSFLLGFLSSVLFKIYIQSVRRPRSAAMWSGAHSCWILDFRTSKNFLTALPSSWIVWVGALCKTFFQDSLWVLLIFPMNFWIMRIHLNLPSPMKERNVLLTSRKSTRFWLSNSQKIFSIKWGNRKERTTPQDRSRLPGEGVY